MADYRRHYDDGPDHREWRDRDRDDAPWSGRPRPPSLREAASEYYRAAREQRDDYLRWEARSPGAEFEDGGEPVPHWARRERGGYWRQYSTRPHFAGRGPKGYHRSDERICDEVCECMTEDPMLDASDISVRVEDGVVVLSGIVASRAQKRRAEDVAEQVFGVKDVANQLRLSGGVNGHETTAPPPVAQASGPGTPSKSTSRTSA